MLTCQDVANYFLVLVDREAGDSITQLKLQKLVYFAQGINFAFYNKPLFKSEIQAWDHGPVVRELRKTFGEFGSNTLPAPGEIDFDIYTSQHKELIYKVYSEYGEHSASYLRNLTHTHSIWQEAYETPQQIIPQEKIKEFFKNLLDKGSIKSDFLSITPKDKQGIKTAEDEWWMNYDSGVLCEKITEDVL